jgi:hypothetical protein
MTQHIYPRNQTIKALKAARLEFSFKCEVNSIRHKGQFRKRRGFIDIKPVSLLMFKLYFQS